MMTMSIPVQPKSLVNGAGSANTRKRSGQREFDVFLDKSIKRETKINLSTKTKLSKEEFNGKILSTSKDKKIIGPDDENLNNQTEDNLIWAMLDQIQNLIMVELDLSPEELDSMMMDLGLKLEDLTDPQAIMQLVLVDSGEADPLAIIMDQELGDVFQGLLAKVNDIKREADIKFTPQEIRQILEQVKDFNMDEAIIEEQETETLQPLINPKNADNESVVEKESNIRLHLVSDQKVTNEQSLVVSEDDSDLSDTRGRKEEADKTDGFENFLDKLSANYDKPLATFDGNEMKFYEIREIAQQIIDQIRVIINPERTTMELQLNPEHLGKVNLTVSSKEGLMTAHFVVENELAKEALEGQMITLKETFDQQGIRVENIEVTVASYLFDQKDSSDQANQMMHKKQGSGQKITFEEAVGISEELQEEDTMKADGVTGYTIDYTA